MSRVDFFISNPGHHVESALPVATLLAREGVCASRIVSLCELRGLRSPAARLADAGLPLATVLPTGVRASPASGRQRRGALARVLRGAARAAAWQGVLARHLRAALDPAPDLAVLPNDGAFPYDRIAALLGELGVPFLLLQEGVRFELPGATDPGHRRHGRGGAAAVAAWGESSAEYFRGRGVAAERIHLVGCPRFDALGGRDWPAEAATTARRLGIGGRLVLLVTNPIDDLGYCSTADKLALVGRFAERLARHLAGSGATLAVKLHGRESEDDYRAALAAAPVEVLRDEPLHPLLAAAAAVVTIASTAGLEALLLGRPLGVLEIPGFGFVHDYVAAGAAIGLPDGDGVGGRLADLLDRPPNDRRVEAYLGRTLAVREGSSARVAALVERLLGDGGRPPGC